MVRDECEAPPRPVVDATGSSLGRPVVRDRLAGLLLLNEQSQFAHAEPGARNDETLVDLSAGSAAAVQSDDVPETTVPVAVGTEIAGTFADAPRHPGKSHLICSNASIGSRPIRAD